MAFPTPHTVGWHAWSEGPEDPHGNPTNVWTPPLDQPGTPTKVMGWQTSRTIEPNETRVQSDIDLLVPPGVTVGSPRDVVDIPLDKSKGQYEVVGDMEDWTTGPFGYKPGAVVKLKRVTG
jgi:hypothetical protein